MAIYNDDLDVIFKNLNSSENGISPGSENQRRTQFGNNQLEKQKRSSFFKKLMLQFKNLMLIILLLSAVVSCVMAIINKDYENLFEAILIFAIVLINAIVGVIQEQKAENALAALQSASEPFATVVRGGEIQKIRSTSLVVGDVLLLKTGALVPADVRLIECQNLKCNESSMTGESNLVSKTCEPLSKKNLPLTQQTNICFSGTTITSGQGKGIVFAVGKNSEIGKIANTLGSSLKEKTPLEKEIDKIGKILSIGILGIVFVVFLVQALASHQSFIGALLTAVTLAVAAIPESLPAVITIIMALGVQRLARKNAIIKKLSAVETLGCCNIICCDKTGTLTKNEMNISHINIGFQTTHAKNFNILSHEKLLQIMAICNNVLVSGNKISGDATETAIAKFLLSQNVDIASFKNSYKKLAESEFNSSSKQMRVLCKKGSSQILLAKGAIDYLLGSCESVFDGEKIVPLTDKLKKKILQQNEDICKHGERVIAFAFKEGAAQVTEDGLVFVGFAGIIDPPKKETFAAIKKCKRAGLATVMITGDHPATALAIAKKLGIASSQKEVLTGSDIDNLSSDELEKNILNFRVFARVSPGHKLRIVTALKNKNNVVAMTGDGINDAPSIKTANIGVCMGITGTDVTKEVADIIISDDNFSTIVLAVEEGRTIYQNITKTIIFLLSTNLVEVLGIFITSLIMPTSTFLFPTQILFINLVTDSLPAFALGIEPTHKNIMNKPPRNANHSLLAGRAGWLILVEGFVQSLAVLVMFVISAKIFNENVANTMAFLTICLMQIIHAINCKTNGSIFRINLFKNKFFNFSFITLFALILTVYFVPFLADLFSLTMITGAQWIAILLTSLSIIPIVEIIKKIVK